MKLTPTRLFHDLCDDGTLIEVWTQDNVWTGDEECYLTVGKQNIHLRDKPSPDFLAEFHHLFTGAA